MTEAEAVLLALGAKIEWEPDVFDSKQFLRQSKRTGEWIRYRILAGAKHGKVVGGYAVELLSDNLEYAIGGAGVMYLTLPVAIAACERHYATGEWE